MERNDSTLDWNLIAAYLLGDLETPARLRFEDQLRHDAVLRDAVRSVRDGLAVTEPRYNPTRVEQATQRLEQKLRTLNTTAAPLPETSSPSRTPSIRRIPRIGTILALGASLVAAWFVTDRFLTDPAHPHAITYETAAGQQSIVTLSDGTRAVLSPETRMVVTSNTTTEVSIQGQAFFSVTPNARIPFLVRTPNAVTRVLGTAFSVRRYATDAATSVIVSDGRVAVEGVTGTGDKTVSTGQPAILSARMQGTIDDAGTIHVASNIVLDDYMAWTTGRLVFRNTPVREIVAELTRTYGVTFLLADSTYADQRLTWTVHTAKSSLLTTANNIATLLDGHVVQSGRSITIVPGQSEVRQKTAPAPSVPAQERQYGL